MDEIQKWSEPGGGQMTAGDVLCEIPLFEGTNSEIIVRERVLGLKERVPNGKECVLRCVFSFSLAIGNMALLTLGSALSV